MISLTTLMSTCIASVVPVASGTVVSRQVSTTTATKFSPRISTTTPPFPSPNLLLPWSLLSPPPLHADCVCSDLAKLLVECHQEIPECLEPHKPDLPSDTPLFDDDDDDDDEEDDAPSAAVAPPVASGASWDSGDNSVVFQGAAAMRTVLSLGG